MKQHYLSVFNLQESLLNTNKNIFPQTWSETSMCALEFVWVRTGTAGLFCMSHGILEHTEPDALCEGLRATIMQQDLISCSSDPSFLPRLFVLFLFVPQPVFFVKRSLSYHTHTHHNILSVKTMDSWDQFKSNHQCLTKQSYLTGEIFIPLPPTGQPCKAGLCCPLLVKKKHQHIQILYTTYWLTLHLR